MMFDAFRNAVTRSLVATGHLPEPESDAQPTDADYETVAMARHVLRHPDVFASYESGLLDVPDEVAQAIDALAPEATA